MLLRVDAGDVRAGAVSVGKGGMTAETKPATAINAQPNRIFGMIIIGAMAIFATDCTMRGVLEVVIFILMAFYTDLGGFVLDRIVLPFGLVGLAVPTVHVAPLLDAKIIWN
jgi:hypothetical protein